MKHCYLLLFIACVFCSCVSKKKHLETIRLLNRIHQDSLTTTANRLKKQLRINRDSLYSLQLHLAEQKGENNVLADLRMELLQHIDLLETQIENLSSSSQNSQAKLNNTLTQKENKIKDLKMHLSQIETVFQARQEAFKKLSSDLLYAFQSMAFEQFELTHSEKGLKLIFPKSVFFRRGSTARIETQGHTVMEAAAPVFERYPIIQIAVINHTDNGPTGRKSIPNNWSLSAIQAAHMVNLMAVEYDINPNQLTAIGKGEYEPRASNDTPEGKALNERIEWVISQRDTDLERDIRKVLASIE